LFSTTAPESYRISLWSKPPRRFVWQF